jgi:hypothetical protein
MDPSDPKLKPIESAHNDVSVVVDDAPAAVDPPPQVAEATTSPNDVSPAQPAQPAHIDVDTLVEQVGGKVWERIAGHVAGLLAQATSEMMRAIAELVQVDVAKMLEADRPTVRFTAAKGWQPVPPRSADDGTIVLYHSTDPDDGTSTEITLGSGGVRVVNLGYRVELPPGWIADVTVDGVAGQRFQVATLSGMTAPGGTLKLALRTNNPVARRISAGSELARLHLRRATPAEVVFVDQHR